MFGALGALLTFAGAFQTVWSANLMPSERTVFVLVCGLGTLASQAGTLLQAVPGDEGGTPWPERRRPRRP